MITLKVTGRIPRIDVARFTKKIERICVLGQNRAVLAWAKAVITKIPTYTGTALGTFAPLNRTIKGLGIASPGGISAKARAKIAAGTRIQGREYQLGFGAGKQYSDHKLSHDISGFEQRYTFEFHNKLPYVMWNNTYPAPAWMHLPSNPPWKAMEAGEAAFDAYVRDYIAPALRTAIPELFVRIGNGK